MQKNQFVLLSPPLASHLESLNISSSGGPVPLGAAEARLPFLPVDASKPQR